MKAKLLVLAVIPLTLSIDGCKKKGDDTIEFDYIFTAQPVVSATSKEDSIYKNVQTDFMTKSGNKKLTQASIFIRNDADVAKATAFLNKVQTDIESGLETPAKIKQGIEQAGSQSEQQNKFGVPGAMAMKVTNASNGFGLGYTAASTLKDDIHSFVNLLTNNNFGDIPDETYFVPSTDEAAIALGYDGIKVLAPTGAPAVGLYGFATYEDFTTTTNPQQGLIPQFQTDNYDVIVAPTQGGLTQIVKNSASYKIAATITYGNFYIISTGKDDNDVMDEGDNVLIFQENDIPGKVFKYLYNDLNLNLTAVAAVSDTKAVIENGGILKP